MGRGRGLVITQITVTHPSCLEILEYKCSHDIIYVPYSPCLRTASACFITLDLQSSLGMLIFGLEGTSDVENLNNLATDSESVVELRLGCASSDSSSLSMSPSSVWLCRFSLALPMYWVPVLKLGSYNSFKIGLEPPYQNTQKLNCPQIRNIKSFLKTLKQ